MQCELPEVNSYQYVNPYEMTYKNMNFEINGSVSKQTAEKIARQLGFMHNAFGIVAKDLIKIVSLSFNLDSSLNQKETPHPKEHRNKKGVNHTNHDIHSGAMDVEQKVLIEEEKIPRRAVIQMEQSEEREGQDCLDGQEEVHKSDGIGRPPNSDIFSQFAYNQSGLPQSKSSNKEELDYQFKQKLFKIVEEVSSKQKESHFGPSLQQQQQIQQICQKIQNQPISEEKKDINQERDHLEPEKKVQMSFLQDQEYNPGSKKDSNSPLPEEVGGSSPKVNQIRTLLNKSHEPAVYEISDDD